MGGMNTRDANKAAGSVEGLVPGAAGEADLRAAFAAGACGRRRPGHFPFDDLFGWSDRHRWLDAGLQELGHWVRGRGFAMPDAVAYPAMPPRYAHPVGLWLGPGNYRPGPGRIFVAERLADGVEILLTLLHEIVHGMLVEGGHGPRFLRRCEDLGIVRSAGREMPDPQFGRWIDRFIASFGPYPTGRRPSAAQQHPLKRAFVTRHLCWCPWCGAREVTTSLAGAREGRPVGFERSPGGGWVECPYHQTLVARLPPQVLYPDVPEADRPDVDALDEAPRAVHAEAFRANRPAGGAWIAFACSYPEGCQLRWALGMFGERDRAMRFCNRFAGVRGVMFEVRPIRLLPVGDAAGDGGPRFVTDLHWDWRIRFVRGELRQPDPTPLEPARLECYQGQLWEPLLVRPAAGAAVRGIGEIGELAVYRSRGGLPLRWMRSPEPVWVERAWP